MKVTCIVDLGRPHRVDPALLAASHKLQAPLIWQQLQENALDLSLFREIYVTSILPGAPKIVRDVVCWTVARFIIGHGVCAIGRTACEDLAAAIRVSMDEDPKPSILREYLLGILLSSADFNRKDADWCGALAEDCRAMMEEQCIDYESALIRGSCTMLLDGDAATSRCVEQHVRYGVLKVEPWGFAPVTPSLAITILIDPTAEYDDWVYRSEPRVWV